MSLSKMKTFRRLFLHQRPRICFNIHLSWLCLSFSAAAIYFPGSFLPVTTKQCHVRKAEMLELNKLGKRRMLAIETKQFCQSLSESPLEATFPHQTLPSRAASIINRRARAELSCLHKPHTHIFQHCITFPESNVKCSV